MKKYLIITIFIIILTILMTNFGYGYSCVSYKDCPNEECAGTVRQCISNICQYSNCIVPKSSDITSRESVESFSDAVKPFEKGINLSKKTKNPSATKNNILSSLGIEKVLFLLLRTMGVFFIALLVALFFVFARSKGLYKILFFIIVPALAIVGIIFLIGGTQGISKILGVKESWNTISYNDFIDSQNKQHTLDDKQLSFLSQRLLNVGEFKISNNNEEVNILVFEIDDNRFIREVKLSNLKGENIIRENEYIIKQKVGTIYRYIFDEDRFIFMITANEKSISNVLNEIINNYPTSPTKSKLFSNDIIAPTIKIITPIQSQITSNNLLSFKLIDNESGIDISTLRISNFDGIDLNLNCIKEGLSYDCSFLGTNLNQGIVNFNINIKDIEGNNKKIASNFVYDSGFVEIVQFDPKDNSYTNTNEVNFKLIDKISGIKSIFIDGNELLEKDCTISKNIYDCNYQFNFNRGTNTVIIETIDYADNKKLLPYTINYDDISPIITLNDYSFEIIEDSPLKIIKINDHNYDISKCSIENHNYFCMHHEKIYNIYIQDVAGNIAKI